jgi:hypothetical protein
MPDHIATMLDLGCKITAAGEQLPDIHITCALVLSLLATVLGCHQNPTFQFRSFETHLIHCQCYAHRHAREKSSETALLTKKSEGRGKLGGGKKSGNG